jgi:hypothetical protein
MAEKVKPKQEIDFNEIMDKYLYNDTNPQDGSIGEYRTDILICMMQASVDTMTVILENTNLKGFDHLNLLNMRTATINTLNKHLNNDRSYNSKKSIDNVAT